MRSFLIVCLLLTGYSVVADEYTTVSPEHLAKMQLDTGDVLIQLIPDVAPAHVERFKSLIRKGEYDGKSFYRVIEGFVAQGGLEDDKNVPALAIEAEFAYQAGQFFEVQSPDLFAPVTGFYRGVAAAADPKNNTAWLTHCPGTIAMARGNEADSATSDFYFVIGQAPRYLDRIMTIFGRVVDGFEHVQQIKRGKSSENGMIKDKSARTLIHKAVIVSDLPKEQQPSVGVLTTSGEAFSERINSRKHRSHAFFFKKPPAVLDVCQIPLPVKINSQVQ